MGAECQAAVQSEPRPPESSSPWVAQALQSPGPISSGECFFFRFFFSIRLQRARMILRTSFPPSFEEDFFPLSIVPGCCNGFCTTRCRRSWPGLVIMIYICISPCKKPGEDPARRPFKICLKVHGGLRKWDGPRFFNPSVANTPHHIAAAG